MICAACHTFHGSPCACCRTVGRLRFLIERGNLPLEKEQEVLTALRYAAGVVADIVEVYGFKGLPLAAPKADEGRTPLPEGGEKVEAGSSKPEETPQVPIESAKKKAKKEASKEKKKRKEAPGVEETPVVEEETREEREPIRRRDIERKSRPVDEERPRTAPAEKLQEEVDSYAEAHPGSFGLGNLPVRGTAAKHFAHQAERGRQRPPEPQGPPPVPRWGQQRSRTPQRKKKSKGRAHRQRGRDYWRGVHARQR